jgi:hypothetical protein
MIYTINNLRFQPQGATNWCWAAVTWMVNDCYTGGNSILQCAIASQITGGQCCPSPPNDPGDLCNTPRNLGASLAAVGHLAGPLLRPPQPFDLVKSEIIAQRPICAEVALPGLTHYVVLSTCADDGSIRVLDPQGWYDTTFGAFTAFNPNNPRGFCTGWYRTQ